MLNSTKLNRARLNYCALYKLNYIILNKPSVFILNIFPDIFSKRILPIIPAYIDLWACVTQHSDAFYCIFMSLAKEFRRSPDLELPSMSLLEFFIFANAARTLPKLIYVWTV